MSAHETDMQWRNLRDARDLARRRLEAAERMLATIREEPQRHEHWTARCEGYRAEIRDLEELMDFRKSELS